MQFFFAAVQVKKKKKIDEVVKRELDLLKHLDSDTTQKYISYQEIFPGDLEDAAMSSDIEEVFSLFSRISITRFWIPP